MTEGTEPKPMLLRLATLGAMTSNAIFGFSFMFSRLALEKTTPFVMLMHRFLLAAVLLTLVALWAGRTHQTGWLRFSLRGKNVLPLLVMGLLQPVGYFLCESYGVSLTNATISGMMIALIPLVAMAMGALFLKETPTRRQLLFAVVSIAGVAMMTLQQQSSGQVRWSGLVLLLGAVVTGTTYNILSRRLSATFSVLERTWVMMVMAAAIFSALALWQNGATPALWTPLQQAGYVWPILYLSVLSSVVAFAALNFANGYLPVARTTSFCNLTTVISLFAGVVFLSEPFSALSLLASGLIIVGVWGVQRG